MSYFGGSVGRGDPGFFGSLFGGIARGVGTILRGSPGGQIVSGVAGAFSRPRQGSIPRVGIPALRAPGGQRGGRATGFTMQAVPRKRRRMNVANDKALRRAIRRQAGFVKLARRALTGTGFKIVSTSSGKVSRSAMEKAVAAAHHAK